MQEKASETATSMPYKFTSKELDPETGLYYFGARYYEPRLSLWTTVDPALLRYLPVDNSSVSNLPGYGGIYNSKNLSMYNYAANNPVYYIDPDGKIHVGAVLLIAVTLIWDGYDIYNAASNGDGVDLGLAIGGTTLDLLTLSGSGVIRRTLSESKHIVRASKSAWREYNNENSDSASVAIVFAESYVISRGGSALINGIGQRFWNNGTSFMSRAFRNTTAYEPSRKAENITNFTNLFHSKLNVPQASKAIANTQRDSVTGVKQNTDPLTSVLNSGLRSINGVPPMNPNCHSGTKRSPTINK